MGNPFVGLRGGRTGDGGEDLFCGAGGDLEELLKSVTVATEEGTVGEGVVEATHCRDFLPGRVCDDGGKGGGSEAGVLRRVEAVEVEELEQENEIRLRLGL